MIVESNRFNLSMLLIGQPTKTDDEQKGRVEVGLRDLRKKFKKKKKKKKKKTQ